MIPLEQARSIEVVVKYQYNCASEPNCIIIVNVIV